MRLFITLLITVILSSCSSAIKHPQQHNIAKGFLFLPSGTVMQDIDAKLLQAKNENKKLLLVLGAQWCHDSKGLAEKFSANNMQKVLAEHYQTLFIDVGYYENGFDVVSRFGMPIYYGTPTVMIIDANSSQLLNADSMQQWLSAASIATNHYLDYFQSEATKTIAVDNEPNQQSALLNSYHQQITEFSQQQAKRLKTAYNILGPALKQNVEHKVKFSEEKNKIWAQARKLRYNIQSDIIALKAQAKDAAKQNKAITLSFPSYEKFSWEK